LINRGVPRNILIRSTTLTTSSPLMCWPTAMARHSRLKLSTIVKALNRRPLNRLSVTKSVLQLSFTADATGCCTLWAALLRLFGFLACKFNPFSQ
jgi:hypothetical protein